MPIEGLWVGVGKLAGLRFAQPARAQGVTAVLLYVFGVMNFR